LASSKRPTQTSSKSSTTEKIDLTVWNEDEDYHQKTKAFTVRGFKHIVHVPEAQRVIGTLRSIVDGNEEWPNDSAVNELVRCQLEASESNILFIDSLSSMKLRTALNCIKKKPFENGAIIVALYHVSDNHWNLAVFQRQNGTTVLAVLDSLPLQTTLHEPLNELATNLDVDGDYLRFHNSHQTDGWTCGFWATFYASCIRMMTESNGKFELNQKTLDWMDTEAKKVKITEFVQQQSLFLIERLEKGLKDTQLRSIASSSTTRTTSSTTTSSSSSSQPSTMNENVPSTKKIDMAKPKKAAKSKPQPSKPTISSSLSSSSSSSQQKKAAKSKPQPSKPTISPNLIAAAEESTKSSMLEVLSDLSVSHHHSLSTFSPQSPFPPAQLKSTVSTQPLATVSTKPLATVSTKPLATVSTQPPAPVSQPAQPPPTVPSYAQATVSSRRRQRDDTSSEPSKFTRRQ
jgi:hypothetical protein